MKKMTPNEADSLIILARQADQYFRHPNVERILGFQAVTRQSMNLDEIVSYLEDHVLNKGGEGAPTAKDRRMMANIFRESAAMLLHPEIVLIRFSLGTMPFAKRLREAAAKIVR